MKRFRMYYDKDAEEVWLNEMCQKGWAMTSFFAGLYTFAPCQPGEYIYQIDMPEGAGFQPNDIEGYTEFMEDAGVEVVQQWYRWVYLRKQAAEGPVPGLHGPRLPDRPVPPHPAVLPLRPCPGAVLLRRRLDESDLG